MKKNLFVVLLTICLMTSSAYAVEPLTEQEITLPSIQNKYCEEIVELNNQKILLTTFDSNGLVSISATSASGEELTPETYRAVSAYLDTEDKRAEVKALQGTFLEEEDVDVLRATGTDSTTQTGYSNSEKYCSVKMNASVKGVGGNPMKLAVTGGYTEGNYQKSEVATSIKLRQKYTFDGISISASWPPGFSFGASDNVGYWDGQAVYNSNYQRSYRDTNISANHMSTLSSFAVTLTDSSDIQVGSTIHKSNTTWKRSMYDLGILY